MKRWSVFLVCALVVALSVVLVKVSPASAEEWRSERIAAYPNDLGAHIRLDGGRLVWEALAWSSEAEWAVDTWEAGDAAPSTIATCTMPDYPSSPQIAVSGERVAWDRVEYLDPNHDTVREDVYTWKEGEAAPTLIGEGSAPQVSGDLVAYEVNKGDWYSTGAEHYYEVLLWDAGTGVTSHIATSGILPRPKVSGDRLVWLQSDQNEHAPAVYDVMTFRRGDAAPSRVATTSDAWHVDVSEDVLVWWSQGGSLSVARADGTVVLLDEDGVHNVRVSGDRVVWAASDGQDLEVYSWRSADFAPVPITDNTTDDRCPDASGDRLIWLSYPDPATYDAELRTRKMGRDDTATLVARLNTWIMLGEERVPRVSGDRIAWTDVNWSDNTLDVWTAVPREPGPQDAEDSIADIIGGFDVALGDGSLDGTGANDTAAENREKALRNKLKAIRELILAGRYAEAEAALQDVYGVCDGESPPPDFVDGPARADLEADVLALMELLAMLSS